ncbi:quinone oxidoreductase [Bryobacterales bacterium F-183]|nr:quinone oxidoreductase [Bryobacterales bacterium F-183]
MSSSFRALVATQVDGKTQLDFQNLTTAQLPPGDVLIEVAYSSLNYKDGLCVTGKPGVMRSFPMVPGIDLAGKVVESSTDEFVPGDSVVLTGGGLAETHWGGYSKFARVKKDYLVNLPAGLSAKQAMAIGTAGFTAMQCVLALEKHGVVPGSKEVVVTGSAGGVGSVAVTILSKLGYRVVASTGRADTADYLRSLGAAEVIDRGIFTAEAKRPLDTERFAGAVDTVGGTTLAGVLRSISYRGAVACCGLAGGSNLPTTVLPFILRGISLLGIDSVRAPQPERAEVWSRLAADLPLEQLDAITTVHPLSDIVNMGSQILAGQVRGRAVVDVNA